MAWLLVPAIGGSDLIDPLVFDGPPALLEDRVEALLPLIIATLMGLAGFAEWILAGREGDEASHEEAKREQAEAEISRLRQAAGAQRREELVFGALLHDVGKLGISERILGVAVTSVRLEVRCVGLLA
ncbi:MAG: hypothetical protein WKF62_07730 [Solirubrobacterales bacterium]